ncbi:MAG: hypothetical protein MUE73_13810 [Planctomycetes bacterium]|jgi:hypothetical protein|nr:hypothetical protein [Planctomycetota bacterium]
MLDAGLLFVFLMAILFILLSTGGDRSESGMGAPIPSVDHPVDETIAPPPPRR